MSHSSCRGIKIAQISDIHSGSFFNKKKVLAGVQMLLDEKPDLIFFTGDLVNNEATEMRDYADVFTKIKAPLGVYSILGNHDYGDYVPWPSREAKMKNLQDLIQTHKLMDWDILINENRILKSNGDKIAILGVENWGAKGNFPKYGKLKEAYKGTEDAPVKLLLSHDPSHWRAQVLNTYKDIDVTFSGHTHGFQFGIETETIKWSPVQYFYKEWAGLYSENDQHLYVNRGFGFLGFPGRIGILPEITIMELEKA
jgi:predicted MPP superfamily phosphohydrolase